jgi:hypothetical protein
LRASFVLFGYVNLDDDAAAAGVLGRGLSTLGSFHRR